MMFSECVDVPVALQKVVIIHNKKSEILLLQTESHHENQNNGYMVKILALRYPQYIPVYLKLVLGRLSQLLGCWRLDL